MRRCCCSAARTRTLVRGGQGGAGAAARLYVAGWGAGGSTYPSLCTAQPSAAASRHASPPAASPAAVSFLGASLSTDFTILVRRCGALALAWAGTPPWCGRVPAHATGRPLHRCKPLLTACRPAMPLAQVTEYCEGGALSANLAAGRITWYRRGKQVRGACCMAAPRALRACRRRSSPGKCGGCCVSPLALFPVCGVCVVPGRPAILVPSSCRPLMPPLTPPGCAGHRARARLPALPRHPAL